MAGDLGELEQFSEVNKILNLIHPCVCMCVYPESSVCMCVFTLSHPCVCVCLP